MNLLRPQARLRQIALVAVLLVSLPTTPAEPSSPTKTTTAEGLIDASPFDLGRLTTPASEHYYFNLEPLPTVSVLFLPPAPPPLGSTVPLANPLATGLPPAPELAAYVADLFYPQLAARLAEGSLPGRLRQKLDAYRLARTALQDQLHTVLARTESADTATRMQELADLAERQAQPIQELDNVAAQLRNELGGISPDKFASAVHAAEKEPGPPSALMSEGELRFLRSAAFHLNGLSTAQRQLLLDTAWQNETLRDAPSGGAPVAFSPLGASLPLPPGLPEPVAAQLAAFGSAKRQLVNEILALLHSFPPADRESMLRRLEDLAAQQAPAFTALDTQAEAIRRALPAPTDPAAAAQPPNLPPELAGRLAAYRNHKQELLRQLHAVLTQTARAAATASPGGLAVPVTAFTPAQQAELVALNREKDTLRAAIAEHRRNTGAAQDRKSIDDLLEAFEHARQAQELRVKYRDYRIAVLEPGLAPGQRRLLFAAALQALDLPLPLGQPLHHRP